MVSQPLASLGHAVCPRLRRTSVLGKPGCPLPIPSPARACPGVSGSVSRVSTAEIGGEEGRKRGKASFTPQFSTGSLVPSFPGVGACPQAPCPSDHPSVDTSVTRPPAPPMYPAGCFLMIWVFSLSPFSFSPNIFFSENSKSVKLRFTVNTYIPTT